MGKYADARLKIERADKHIQDLYTAVGSLPNAYTSTIEIDHNIPAQSIKYDFPGVTPFLRDIALITGDAIHNLRTSLDYAWMETIRRVAPIALNKYAKFPVRETATELENTLRGAEIHLASPPLFNCILSQVKPYLSGNTLLYALHRLDIADKHHLLLPLINHAVIEGIEVEDEMGARHKGGTWLMQGVGPYYVSFRTDYKIHDQGKLFVQVVLNDRSALKGLEILDALQALGKVSLYVVETLELVV